MAFLIAVIIVSLVLFSTASTSDDLGTHKIIYRKEWGGRPPQYTTPLIPPVDYVIISHSATPFLTNSSDCAARIRNIQDYHVTLSSPDVGYNFLICGDGNVYVGRDWDAKNFHTVENSIGICFIGNFVYDSLTDSMIEAAQLLLNLGLEKKVLNEEYKLVGHNQTFNTLSPGQNVYKVIKEWSHFYPGEVKN